MRSYYVRYWAEDGKPMIGGVFQSESSRFQRRQDAELRLAAVREVHEGRQINGEILESGWYPEIFLHCPEPSEPQAIGGKCFGCGKLLTVADAEKAGELPPSPAITKKPDWRVRANADGQAAMQALAKGVNSTLADPFNEAFIDEFFNQHRTIQQNIIRLFRGLCVEFTARVARDGAAKWVDGRNEASAQLAREISGAAIPLPYV